MNKKILLAVSALFLSSIFTAYSQVDNEDEAMVAFSAQSQNELKYNTYKTTWLKNRFKDTWFVTFGSGAQMIMATDDDKGPFKDRITYAPTFTLGKYFSPIWGLRVQFTGGSLHGFNDGSDGIYRKWNSGSKNYQGQGYAENLGMTGVTSGPHFMSWDPSWAGRGFSTDAAPGSGNRIIFDGDNYIWEGYNQNKVYMQHFQYVAANFNFMFDFLTLVGNYNPKRAFEITPFAGLTAAHMFSSEGQSAFNTLGANGGLNFKIRLSKKFDFNLEGSVTALPDEFDGQMGGSRSFDIITQATGGITYKIGKSTWDVADPMNYHMIEDLNMKINDLRNQLENANTPCPECPECPPVVQVVETESVKETRFLPDPVFFRIDKAIIDASEWSKIETAADYLSRHPNTNIIVTGYADRKTGNPAHNLRLSERRAKAVAKALTDRFGVNPLRLSINWEGDKIQPFAINAWNRVVVFVIED